MKTRSSFSGSFLVWEPISPSSTDHRLLDSNQPATTYFKRGRITVDGETVILKKSRNFIRALVFAALTPVWGGLVIGIGYLSSLISETFTEHHMSVILLSATVLMISVFVLALRKFIKPVRRQFPRAQIANVRTKQVQVTEYLRTTMPPIGIDFSVISPESIMTTAEKTGSFAIANVAKCSFVTVVACGTWEAKHFADSLPATQVALFGQLNVDIPPQQVAPRAVPQTQSVGSNPSSPRAGIVTEKRYSHNPSLRLQIGSAAFFGAIAFWVGHEALTNHRGLILNGIHMGVTGASIFYSLVAAFCGFLFVILVRSLVQTIFNPHSLLLNQEGVTFFQGWLKPKVVLIPFHAIENVSQQQSLKGGTRTLILMVKGKQFPIREVNLNHPTFYPEICQVIAAGQQNVRKKNEPPPPKPPPAPAQGPQDDSRYMPKR